jgi:hypothetical protein
MGASWHAPACVHYSVVYRRQVNVCCVRIGHRILTCLCAPPQGWDWAPYSQTSTNSSGNTSGAANSFSKGIWKSVCEWESFMRSFLQGGGREISSTDQADDLFL